MSSFYSGSYCLNRNKQQQHHFGFTIIIGTLESLQEFQHLLSSTELDEFSHFKYPKRKTSFLLGRISAKMSIGQIHQVDLRSITIGVGVFGFPVVKGTSNNTQVSITHCENIGVSLAYQEDHPISVDIEKIDPNRLSLLEKYLSPLEANLLNAHCSREMSAFMAWTSKEALSKVLRTGLTLDFKIMSINKTEKLAEGIYINTFLNFPQYKSYTLRVNNMVCSIVVPEKSFFEYSGIIDLKNQLNQIIPTA